MKICRLAARSLLIVFVAGCAAAPPASSAQVKPAPVAERPVSPAGPATHVAVVPTRVRSLPPAEAFRAGLMALGSTGVSRFAEAHPTEDGRGVLIAILDTGIDPSVPGLQVTTDGLPKVLDLRDFSGEGRVRLSSAERRGDTLLIAGHRLIGATRVAALAQGGEVWGGALEELPLGEPPAADINGNGTVGDSLPVVVVRSGSGWTLFADADGNGTLANDRPVRDYAVARETFGWTSTNAPASVTLAANLSDSAGAPILDLFFDTSSHGSHVAGIAAGHNIYDVEGFDGVAPGARLIGLKIANDAHGGVSVSTAMRRALAYAIAFAHERRLPLVVNLSFGVGSAAEGTARVDMVVDSLLAEHPDVVMTVAAGNDGPGLGTVGVPGSASRVLSIGASQPPVFGGLAPSDSAADVVALFSSRGGSIAAPDLIAPGTAYSTVPQFATGGEQESGTSMATPYVAGLAARLLSGTDGIADRPAARAIGQALRRSARLPRDAGALDAGWGLPDINLARESLRRDAALPELLISAGGHQERGAILLTSSGGRVPPQHVIVSRRDGAGALNLVVRSSAPWVRVPAGLSLPEGRGELVLAVDAARLPPGAHDAVVELLTATSNAAVLARIPVTVRVPMSASARVATQAVKIGPAGVQRVFIPAEAGRGMQVEIGTAAGAPQVTASLHEPGGMPFRDGAQIPAGSGDGAALFDIGGGDVQEGVYELDVVSGPLAGSAATVTVRRAPVVLDASIEGDSVRVAARSVIGTPVSVRLRAGLVGAERRIAIHRADGAPLRIAIAVPQWASRMQVDARMPPEQWRRFTDLGMTFQDRRGRQFATAPIDYPLARAAPPLPHGMAGDTLVVLLSPAFADPGTQEWRLDFQVRFYPERVVGLDSGGKPAVQLSAGKSLEQRFFTGPLPIDLSGGLTPVLIVLAQEGEDSIWMREISPQGGKAR
ncbi:MAG: S8 family serine peptidase [Gemmatimonadota bacterium]